MSLPITLTKGFVAYVSARDYKRVSQYKWQAHVNEYKKWYAKRKFNQPDGTRKTIFMHRFILDAPDGMHVDHNDGDGLNNTRSNIKVMTAQENLAKAQNKSVQTRRHGKKVAVWL